MIICTCFGCKARFSGRIELDFLIGIVSLEIFKKLWQLNTDRTEFSSVVFTKRFRILQGMMTVIFIKNEATLKLTVMQMDAFFWDALQ